MQRKSTNGELYRAYCAGLVLTAPLGYVLRASINLK
jgi:hypothetical protein